MSLRFRAFSGQDLCRCDAGGAGHSLEAAKLIGTTGHLIGIDQDQVALDAATARLFALPDEIRPEIDVLSGNFGMLDELLVEAEVPQIDAILFDIGVSSVQIDTPSRGFSFKENGPLDMRMNPSKHTITAAEIINTKNATDLARIIRSYSDEKWANRIAEFIVKTREKAPITESQQLVEIIKAAIPPLPEERRASGQTNVSSVAHRSERGARHAPQWIGSGDPVGLLQGDASRSSAIIRSKIASSKILSKSTPKVAPVRPICPSACVETSRYSRSSPASPSRRTLKRLPAIPEAEVRNCASQSALTNYPHEHAAHLHSARSLV